MMETNYYLSLMLFVFGILLWVVAVATGLSGSTPNPIAPALFSLIGLASLIWSAYLIRNNK